MTLYELIELSQGIGYRIDAQWGFFLTVHMALFGGIIYVDRPLRKTEKLVAVALYTGFAAVNYLMLSNQLNLLQTIYNEISLISPGEQSSLVNFFVERAKSGWFDKANFYSVVVHIVMLVIVVLTVVYDKKR